MTLAPHSHAQWQDLQDPQDPTPRMHDVVGLARARAAPAPESPAAAPDLHHEPTRELATRAVPAVRKLPTTGYVMIEVVEPASAARAARDEEDLSGATLPPCYYLESRHAEGGMGVIYRARHLYLDRTCAVKVPRAPTSSEERRRLRREGRLGACIDHPNVVRVFDCGMLRDLRPFLVMELLAGPSLRQLLQGAPLSVARSCRLAAQVARGLAALHALGVVHRDVKPSNLLVVGSGDSELVKIVDLGLSKRPGEPEDEEISLAGVVLGTPGYLAPEQRRGEDADPRTDQYALGCVLFEMLTGVRVAQELLPPLEALDGLPEVLVQVVRRTLQEEPQARFQDSAALARALAPFARSEEIAAAA